MSKCAFFTLRYRMCLSISLNSYFLISLMVMLVLCLGHDLTGSSTICLKLTVMCSRVRAHFYVFLFR